MESNKKIGLAIGAAAVVAIAGLSIAKSNKDTEVVTPQPTEATVPTETAAVPTSTTTNTVAGASYKDGTYSATGSYKSPGGMDKLGVTITLKGDVVTDATVTEEAGDKTSVKFQDMFIAGYKEYVVGKNISTISVGKVSGSSLTSIGFNDALAQIKAKAEL
jgi:uncharacterized protein with FMN-binding domain